MKKAWLKRDIKGEIGVGSMIIFIALVLIAAAAASVIINTANKVQDQATSTGDQAIDGVSAGLNVQSATGEVASVSGDLKIEYLFIDVKLVAGSPNMNIRDMLLYVNTDDPVFNSQTLTKATLKLYTGSDIQSDASVTPSGNTEYYGAKNLASGDYSGWDGGYVIGQGDTIQLVIPCLIPITTNIQVKMVPVYGSSATLTLTTPSVYSGTGYVLLR